jgi:hypothetical protein
MAKTAQLIILLVVIGIVLFFILSNGIDKQLAEIAKQQPEIKSYYELHTDAIVSVAPPNSALGEEYFFVSFCPPSGCMASHLITDLCDQAYVKILKDGTVLEAKCVACDKKLCAH